MLVARNTEFGGPEVVRLYEALIPTIKPDQALVRVYASTVSSADCRLRSRRVPRGFGFMMGLIFGFSRPKYLALGTEAAGEVTEVGAKCQSFKVGDRIVANLGMKLGGHAQYVVIDQKTAAAQIPQSLGYEEAAALVFGGTTALSFLRDKLKLQRGEKLLVVGAGGAVGSAAVQLGSAMGAVVTGVCSHSKLEVVAKLGANEVIPYDHKDWRTGSDVYDVILDTVGGCDLPNCRQRLRPSGRLGLVVADLPQMLISAWQSLLGQQKASAGPFPETSADLEALVSLCEQGRFRPLIGQIFPLNEIVAAHRAVESGHKLGSLVIRMWPQKVQPS